MSGILNLLLRRFCSRASRSGLRPFVSLAQTLRTHAAGIEAAIRLGINNAQHEGLNRRVRLIIDRAYGFHSAEAALALIMPWWYIGGQPDMPIPPADEDGAGPAVPRGPKGSR